MARINDLNQIEKQLPQVESRPGRQNDIHTRANNRETPLLNPDFKVTFGKDDPDDPRNFGNWHKVYITCQLSMLTFVAALGSSILSPGQSDVAEYTNISSEVAVLATSMYILGWAVGPTLWGPISEVYGRKWGMLPALFCLGLFSIGTAVSQNAASIFITRFIGGIFGSAPISNANAALSDIYAPKERGIAVAFMMLCITGGPSVGPLIGSAVVSNSKLGWRWTMYIEAICCFALFALATLTLSETYSPVLLKNRAQNMRKTTGEERYWHPHEHESISLKNAVTKHFLRPIRMLTTESILACVAAYVSFSYGLIYLCLQVYPIVFEEVRGYSPVIASLPFLGILVGTACAVGITFAYRTRYAKAVMDNGGKAVPEARLPPLVLGVIFLPTGLFWLGWTAAPNFSWVLPTVGGVFVGAGNNIIFQQCINYLIDTYGPYAASAVSANTMLRSFVAAGLPLAAKPMFHNLGVGPAASLMGGIACLAFPIPFVFMKYGRTLREKSKFAPASSD
ncbi:bicyclomycin resistance protein [Aspergillus eucalypticola CBS 122712]|uniref:Bicyclomycin resistance protein n=1 Tax=Aspergillus eucalypticola (strain CBS 122712 / IBT 29274) TaxID=1448314 RepID=A0A317WGB3_ASPEC|nr:bicyclomycin resistance protein [Aspergillus eucalypticola CBS 122712]PWY84307.1 bicyclomycin resistance protein [Aspergillus eucalypticola CBS 122712]